MSCLDLIAIHEIIALHILVHKTETRTCLPSKIPNTYICYKLKLVCISAYLFILTKQNIWLQSVDNYIFLLNPQIIIPT